MHRVLLVTTETRKYSSPAFFCLLSCARSWFVSSRIDPLVIFNVVASMGRTGNFPRCRSSLHNCRLASVFSFDLSFVNPGLVFLYFLILGALLSWLPLSEFSKGL